MEEILDDEFSTRVIVVNIRFRYADVKAVRLVGYTKHSGSQPGVEPISSDKTSYCAIQIDDSWYFVDPNWGSTSEKSKNAQGYVLIDDSGQGIQKGDGRLEVKATTNDGGCIYQCDESYFMPDAERFIFTHIPIEEKWQLLARPVTLREFTEMAFLKDPFFDLGLEVLNQKQAVITTSIGNTNISFNLKTNKQLTFYYRLWLETSNQNSSLLRCVQMQQFEDILECLVFFPVKGNFKFELYGAESPEIYHESATVTYKLLCSYVIQSIAKTVSMSELPHNMHQEWGPGQRLQACGINAKSHHHAVVQAVNGQVRMCFGVDHIIDVGATLCQALGNGSEESPDINGCVTHFFTHDRELVIYISLPETGTYSLSIYIKDIDNTNTIRQLSWACSYIIKSSHESSPKKPYPVKMIGPSIQPDTSQEETHITQSDISPVHCISHREPLIQCPDSGIVKLTISGINQRSVVRALVESFDGKRTHLQQQDHIWIFQKDNTVDCTIRFNEASIYIFYLFAKDQHLSKSFTGVYTMIINVLIPQSEDKLYPLTYEEWDDSFKLIEPQYSPLLSDKLVHFRFQAPHVHEVIVVTSNDVYEELFKDADDFWCGTVNTGQSGTLKIRAQLHPDKNSYHGLLVYSVSVNININTWILKSRFIRYIKLCSGLLYIREKNSSIMH